MKRKIVLISSFCDTDEKKEVLKENLKIIKNLGLETILISKDVGITERALNGQEAVNLV